MAELVLSAALSVLFKKLRSPELRDFATQEKGVRSKLEKLNEALNMINALHIDTEETQLRNEAVKMWLEELQDLAYDAEDILDECATVVLRRQLKIEERRATTSRAWKLIPNCCTGIGNPQALWSNLSMCSKIDGITSRLQHLCNQRPSATSLSAETDLRSLPTVSLQFEPVVYGRDEDRAKILEMVLSDEPGDANYGVVSIIGMGGLGKTTLAKLVYNDEATADFDPKGWICVSDDFDVTRISKAILESITEWSTDLTNLDAVQNQLKERLTGRKFLFVLDDVWNEDYGKWQILRSPFMVGARGSKIIVTTRLERVALTMGHSNGCHRLLGLSDDDCWSLFKKHAIDNKVLSSHPVELIRQKVVEKCKGLPLAARALAGLLRFKKIDDWLDILNSKTWGFFEESGISTVLQLSYYHLPSHLKRCFVYCGILPKGYEFEQKELVFLWMAEGLIQQSTDDNQLEELGGTYFHDFLSRSFFQRSSHNSFKFIMHDLVHDFAQTVSQPLSFRLEDELINQLSVTEKTRYASHICHQFDGQRKFEVFNAAKCLRTYLTVPPVNDVVETYYISNSVVSNLLSRFKMLRALSLQKYYIVELPDSIEGLILLRYLNLSETYIRSLPKSINSMCNLQTLLLRNCSKLLEWPNSMGNLINLRHFDVMGASSIGEMPEGIGKWKCLLTLSNFIVGKDFRSSLKDLEGLKFLCGELHISRLQNVTNFQDITNVKLSDKKGLKVLLLEWGSRFDESRDEEVDSSVLDILRPHYILEKLTIKGYGGKKFSTWVGDSLFTRITVLKLEDCKKCTFLPSLGLLVSLKTLTIKGMKQIKSIGSEFYGESVTFQSLETLYFEDLEEWEYWDSVQQNESFPYLTELSVINCPKLSKKLPHNLSLLRKLVIRGCEELVVLLSNIPMLCELELDKCKKIECSSSVGYKPLKSLEIGGCKELLELWQNEIFLKKTSQGLHNLISSNQLVIKNCNTLTTLPEGIKLKNAEVEELRIESCNSLRFIFRGQLPPSLRKLSITACEQLQSLLDENEYTSTSSSGSSSAIMPFVKNVNTGTSLLDDLYIKGCPSLYLPLSDRLSTTLTRLHISNCSKLTTLSPSGHLPVALQHLTIKRCSELTTLITEGQLPNNLETLKIGFCRKLESLPNGLNKLSYLSEVHIRHCDALASFPEGGFPSSTNLRVIFDGCGKLSSCPGFSSLLEGGFSNNYLIVLVKDCPKLKPPPNRVHILPSLKICNCPNMSIREESLPSGLVRLSIDNFKFHKPLLERKLQELTALRDLQLSGWQEGAESFQGEDMGIKKLPCTLTLLSIEKFPNLKFLPSLDELSSLEKFAIIQCPKVESLPNLPSSLLKLDICDCTLLKKACKRDTGKEWYKIADILCIILDGKFIYDPEEEALAN